MLLDTLLYDCSSEAEDDPALRSKSSRRLFKFFPDNWSVFVEGIEPRVSTVVPLSNTVLYPASLGKIRYLGPVLVRTGTRLGTRAHGTASAMFEGSGQVAGKGNRHIC